MRSGQTLRQSDDGCLLCVFGEQFHEVAPARVRTRRLPMDKSTAECRTVVHFVAPDQRPKPEIAG